MESVFTKTQYKEFIKDYLKSHEKSWGQKALVCKAMGIHSAYLSQVLEGTKHLSLEQVEGLGVHINLTDAEMEYLLLMVQKDRAGTKTLENFFWKKLNALKEKHTEVSSRLGKKDDISEKGQTIYFSSWIYSAIHACLLVEKFRTIEAISARLSISEKEAREAITFLKEIGMVQEDRGVLQPTAKWMRIKSNSPHMIRHHQNACFKTSESIYKLNSENLHYSGVFAFSYNDFVKLKELWMTTLQEAQQVIKTSPEEDVFSIGLHLFKM